MNIYVQILAINLMRFVIILIKFLCMYVCMYVCNANAVSSVLATVHADMGIL